MRLSVLLVTLCCALLLLLAAPVQASQPVSPRSAEAAAEVENVEVEDAEASDAATAKFCQVKRLRDHMDLLNAPIRSHRDLARHLRLARDEGSPLFALSNEARRRFLASLSFNENGLTGYRYDDLERELTATQAYLILALFGSQSDVARFPKLREKTSLDRELKATSKLQCSNGDWVDFQCVARATCRAITRYICKATC